MQVQGVGGMDRVSSYSVALVSGFELCPVWKFNFFTLKPKGSQRGRTHHQEAAWTKKVKMWVFINRLTSFRPPLPCKGLELSLAHPTSFQLWILDRLWILNFHSYPTNEKLKRLTKLQLQSSNEHVWQGYGLMMKQKCIKTRIKKRASRASAQMGTGVPGNSYVPNPSVPHLPPHPIIS